MTEIFFKHIKKENLERIQTVRDGCWINIENSTVEELEEAAKLAELDLVDLEDSLDLYELPRIEREKDGKVIIFVRDTHEHVKEDIFYTNLLTIIITNKYFITISPTTNKTIRNIIQKGVDFSTTQKSKLATYILLSISRNFTKEIKNVRTNVFTQKKNLENIEGLDIIELIKNEEILNQYISALVPMRNVFETIAKGGYIQLFEYDSELLEDMINGIRQSVDICTVSIKSINNLRESYQAIFTNKLNKTIRLLTSLTIIFTVPTIIGSLYGMNVALPLGQNPLAFYFIIALIIIISILLSTLFYIKKWL
jgi:magnesium transporter